MRRAHLIGFCLAFVGAYGVLYAMHAGRSATDPIYELESRVDENASKANDLESEIEDIKASVEELQYRR